MPNKVWTRRQLQILRDEYPRCSEPRGLANRLNRSYHALKTKVRLLRLKRAAPNANYGRTKATAADDRFIIFNYLTMPISMMATKLGYSEGLIRNRMKFLSLVVPPEIISIFKELPRFKKGDMPKTKGLRQSDFMSPEAIKRSSVTRFKKGNSSKRWVGFKDGDIKIRHSHKERGERPYKYIRLSIGKWYPLHQHRWEAKNGKLPAGHCLWFKDGDTLNTSLRNLELITRAENMHRNSASRRLTDNYIAHMLSRQKGGIGIFDRELVKIYLQDKDLLEVVRQAFILKRIIKEKTNARGKSN